MEDSNGTMLERLIKGSKLWLDRNLSQNWDRATIIEFVPNQEGSKKKTLLTERYEGVLEKWCPANNGRELGKANREIVWKDGGLLCVDRQNGEQCLLRPDRRKRSAEHESAEHEQEIVILQRCSKKEGGMKGDWVDIGELGEIDRQGFSPQYSKDEWDLKGFSKKTEQ